MSDLIYISKEIGIDAGHRVPGHLSKCRNPHGHRYRILVHCTGTIIEEPGAADEGMLVDFGDLKTIMMEEIDAVLDHGFIVYEDDNEMLDGLSMNSTWKVIKFPYVPTAENIARWIWDRIEPRVNAEFRNNLTLSGIEVFETPSSRAVYTGEQGP